MDLKKRPVWIKCKGHLIRDAKMKPLYMIGCSMRLVENKKRTMSAGFWVKLVSVNT